jgi:hypothetical protein
METTAKTADFAHFSNFLLDKLNYGQFLFGVHNLYYE